MDDISCPSLVPRCDRCLPCSDAQTPKLLGFNRPPNTHTGPPFCPHERWCGGFDRGGVVYDPHSGRHPVRSTRPCPRFPTAAHRDVPSRTRTCYCHSTMQLMREGHAADDLDNAALGSEALKCSVTPLATMNGIHKARFALCHHLARWSRR